MSALISAPCVSQAQRLLLGAALAGAAALLSGCIVAPLPQAGPATVMTDTGAVVMAPTAPPAPYPEVVTIAPSPLSVWIGGFWGWGGGRYAWNPGHWANPPRPGAGWVAPHWNQRPGGGWGMSGGHWSGPRGGGGGRGGFGGGRR